MLYIVNAYQARSDATELTKIINVSVVRPTRFYKLESAVQVEKTFLE